MSDEANIAAAVWTRFVRIWTIIGIVSTAVAVSVFPAHSELALDLAERVGPPAAGLAFGSLLLVIVGLAMRQRSGG